MGEAVDLPKLEILRIKLFKAKKYPVAKPLLIARVIIIKIGLNLK